MHIPTYIHTYMHTGRLAYIGTHCAIGAGRHTYRHAAA